MGEDYLTLRSATKHLGITVRTLREWVVRKKIKAVKNDTGYRWLIPAAEIKRVLEERGDGYERGEYPE